MSETKEVANTAEATPVKEMTKAERNDLLSIGRKRERVALDDADVRAAQLKTDFENHLSAIYSWDQHEKWAEVYAKAKEIERHGNSVVAEACRELGIPPQFAPSMTIGWRSRGENASASRRAELRRAAYAQIDEWCKTAKHVIRKRSAETQTNLLARGLTTAEAHLFLSAMPTPEELMPAMTMDEAKRFLKMESSWKNIQEEQEKLERKEKQIEFNRRYGIAQEE